MGKNNIEDLLKSIESDNSKYEILLNRIDILNRIIKELEKSNDDYQKLQLSIGDSANKDKEIDKLKVELKEKNDEINGLRHDNNAYMKENEKYKRDNESFKGKINDYENKQKKDQEYIKNLELKIADLNCIVESMKQKENFYSDIDVAYSSYCSLDDDVKEMFAGFIFTESIEAFAASVSVEQKLLRFYKKINDYVMRYQDEIKENHGFLKQQRILANLFDFYYRCLVITDRNTNYGRISAQIGQDYDDELCTRIGDPFGKIEDVLIQGYTTDGEPKALSIVLVRE